MSFGLTQQVLWYRCWGLDNSPWAAVSLACVHVLVGSTILSLFFGILFLFPIIVLGVLSSFLLLFWDIIYFSLYCFRVLFSFLLLF